MRRFVGLCIFVLSLFLFSCTNYSKYFSTGKYADEKLLYSQKIKGNKSTKTFVLKEQLDEEPVSKVIFPWYMPTLGIYLQAEKDTLGPFYPYNKTKINAKYERKVAKYQEKIKALDTTNKERYVSKKLKYNRRIAQKKVNKDKKLENGNWAMRALGDPPPLFNYADVYSSQLKLKNYLNSIGYLNAKVTPEVKFKNHKAYVTYKIEENDAFKIIRYDHEVPREMRSMIKLHERNSKIQVQDNLNMDKIAQERADLYRLAKNNGFFKFEKQNIQFEIDTVSRPKKAKIKLIIDENTLSDEYEKFYINDIFFVLDGDQENVQLDTVIYNDIHFIHHESNYSKKLLHSKIRIHKGDLYSYASAEETQNQLGSIDVFNFVNINYVEADSSMLNAFIYVSSSKKHQISTEGGVNVNVYANSGKGQGLPGPFINAAYKNRKVFRGFEIFQANVSYALAGQININENFRSQELYGNAALLIPKTLGPNVGWKLFKKFNQSTRINLGYSNIDRVEYQRSSINTYIGYQFQKNKERYNFSPLDFTFINAEIKDSSFKEELGRLNRSVIESFANSLISSSNLTYTFEDNDPLHNKKSRFIRFSIESGGTFLNFIKAPSELFGDYSTFTYFKTQWDYRFKVPISQEGAFAYRINVGLAKTTGNTAALPYVKYFFMGGLNSNRAWPARRLGPGTYAQKNDAGENTYENEQPGEIIVESSFELRENIIGVLDVAFFVDIGNIWTFNEEEKPGSEFKIQDFYKDLAVGTGAGLRLDFSFLILRFDVGIKTWDPARQEVLPSEDRFAYNLGIGYPF